MEYNKLEKLVKNSRCTRRYQKDIKVDIQDLEELINLARVSSSAKNMQPLKYILVTQKQAVKKLAKTATWAAHLTDWNQDEDEIPSAFILVLNDTSIDGFAMFDAGVAFQTISLAATSKNLDVCALASIDKNLCKELFKIPSSFEILIGISIGKANEIIKLVEVENEDTNYYRDTKDTHCVPKRDLNDIILSRHQ
ncbi:hypothetical protein CP960_08570 [Malaciobacter halophilus]|uniref:Nitroreductase domain-containing protein n=1 Tax=Malaciobacter halophilus TaxID=197482 RepID=A0A2N1J262_9BACT|nr:nitroreductase family protein [Malaciobacter halophilus]AXH10109.1 nitroreductase family protein [Malaciobacter halophilus]PKI80594.1 hypothetical protein CP960_08570 [Malaciobacter halophilus]